MLVLHYDGRKTLLEALLLTVILAVNIANLGMIVYLNRRGSKFIL